MNTQRLRELCDAVENGSARAEDVQELARLARTVAKALMMTRALVASWDSIRVTSKASFDYRECLRGCAKSLSNIVGA